MVIFFGFRGRIASLNTTAFVVGVVKTVANFGIKILSAVATKFSRIFVVFVGTGAIHFVSVVSSINKNTIKRAHFGITDTVASGGGGILLAVHFQGAAAFSNIGGIFAIFFLDAFIQGWVHDANWRTNTGGSVGVAFAEAAFRGEIVISGAGTRLFVAFLLGKISQQAFAWFVFRSKLTVGFGERTASHIGWVATTNSSIAKDLRFTTVRTETDIVDQHQTVGAAILIVAESDSRIGSIRAFAGSIGSQDSGRLALRFAATFHREQTVLAHTDTLFWNVNLVFFAAFRNVLRDNNNSQSVGATNRALAILVIHEETRWAGGGWAVTVVIHGNVGFGAKFDASIVSTNGTFRTWSRTTGGILVRIAAFSNVLGGITWRLGAVSVERTSSIRAGQDTDVVILIVDKRKFTDDRAFFSRSNEGSIVTGFHATEHLVSSSIGNRNGDKTIVTFMGRARTVVQGTNAIIRLVNTSRDGRSGGGQNFANLTFRARAVHILGMVAFIIAVFLVVYNISVVGANDNTLESGVSRRDIRMRNVRIFTFGSTISILGRENCFSDRARFNAASIGAITDQTLRAVTEIFTCNKRVIRADENTVSIIVEFTRSIATIQNSILFLAVRASSVRKWVAVSIRNHWNTTSIRGEGVTFIAFAGVAPSHCSSFYIDASGMSRTFDTEARVVSINTISINGTNESRLANPSGFRTNFIGSSRLANASTHRGGSCKRRLANSTR